MREASLEGGGKERGRQAGTPMEGRREGGRRKNGKLTGNKLEVRGLMKEQSTPFHLEALSPKIHHKRQRNRRCSNRGYPLETPLTALKGQRNPSKGAKPPGGRNQSTQLPVVVPK